MKNSSTVYLQSCHVLPQRETRAEERKGGETSQLALARCVMRGVLGRERSRARTVQGGRKDGRGNEPLPLRNVRCAEPPEDSLTLQCRLFMDEEVDELGAVQKILELKLMLSFFTTESYVRLSGELKSY